MNFRIGADIGGTFTDLVIVDDNGATFEITKVLTTPVKPDEAVLKGTSQLLKAFNVSGTAVSQVIHGTTLFTNAVIERKGAVTALITTKGFRDAIEIAREHRYDMYDLRMQRPRSLAPRHLRFEVDERVLVDGSVRKQLEDGDVHAVARQLAEAKVEAVAVCLIHAYANDIHERRIGEILREVLPNVSVTLSSELVPELREYERTSTTLVNVYVKGIAEQYLSQLRSRLSEEAQISGNLYVMQSNGGVCEIETATRFPARLIESGPAAGALAAASYGKMLGHDDLFSFDMGGTTAKACLIVEGEPLIAPDFEVDRQYQFKKGSGFPVKVPVIEMIEIGTGGGSIARVDALKRLRVGPKSAGSNPGPASYELGGTKPTVTDADLALGYLDPEFFLGGTMSLDSRAAHQVIANHIAAPLAMETIAAAWGVHQLANESMASAARMHAIERGKDIEKFPVFAFGGAGPVHAYGVARILGSPQIIYPLRAGVMSAIGFLTAPLSFDFVRTLQGPLEALDWGEAAATVAKMEAEGAKILSKTVPLDQIAFTRYADMRYRMQGYEIRVPVPERQLDETCKDQLEANFEAVYTNLYGHTVRDTPIDVVSWRVVASGPKPEMKIARQRSANTVEPSEAIKAERPIYLPGSQSFSHVPVYDRYQLEAGAEFQGPAIVEERESTVVINGPATLAVDQWGNLIAKLDLER